MHKSLLILAVLFSIGAILLAGRHQDFRRIKGATNGNSWRALSAGRGTPTVVFESGAGSPLETWARIQSLVGRFTSTFSYDRAGLGLSAKGATPRDGERIAAELHAALSTAQVSPPYVLVGHSLGGPFVRIFAGMYPSDVAGLVLVDPTQEDLVEWAKSRKTTQPKEHPFRPHDEVDCAPLTFAQAKTCRLPDVPVTLITGIGPREIPDFLPASLKQEVQRDQESLYPAKLKFHQRWVESLPQGRIVITEKSGHGIPWEEPELVVEVIREVVARVRASPSSTIRRDKP
jgi:pimeloyl-ACP methyl ester carboxylesterase